MCIRIHIFVNNLLLVWQYAMKVVCHGRGSVPHLRRRRAAVVPGLSWPQTSALSSAQAAALQRGTAEAEQVFHLYVKN